MKLITQLYKLSADKLKTTTQLCTLHGDELKTITLRYTRSGIVRVKKIPQLCTLPGGELKKITEFIHEFDARSFLCKQEYMNPFTTGTPFWGQFYSKLV